MSMINIGGDAADASYRYKMPRLINKIEGRGNGIKTVIPNCVDIAKALHCHPAYVTKFFGIELGAQSKYTAATERSVVNGAHTAPDLQKLLEKYIDVFILCPTCRLPEIKWEVKKGNIKIDCAACGHNGVINSGHKLVSYVTKNHKDLHSKGGEDGKKDKKKDKKDKKKDKKEKKEEAGEEDEEDEKEDTQAAKPKSEDKEEEEAWFTDTSKEAQKARKKQEFEDMGHSTEQSEVDKILEEAEREDKMDDPVTMLRLFLAGKERTVSEIEAEAKRLQLARGLDEPQKVKAVLAAVVDTKVAKIESEYKKHSEILKVFATNTAGQNRLLCCIEDQIGEVHPELIGRVPMVLQTLYDSDVVDEESLLGWYNTPAESSWLVSKETASKTRARAKPFMEWLQDAESEEESD